MIDIREGIDYNFVERAESDFYSIKLLTSKWQGVIYTYGRVSIKEVPAEDRAVLSFDFRIEDTSEAACLSAEVLQDDPEFKNWIGDILASILDNSDIQIGKDGTKSTDNNSKGTNTR